LIFLDYALTLPSPTPYNVDKRVPLAWERVKAQKSMLQNNSGEGEKILLNFFSSNL
jgi:hypothetical protein